MTSADSRLDGILLPSRAEEVQPRSLLGLSTSLKPSLGAEGNSAARTILLRSLEAIGRAYKRISFLDLRRHPVPLFDGRLPHDYEDEAVELCCNSISRAGAVWLSVPAYWCGVSGVFKNLIDVLCGPAYELSEAQETVFAGKPVGLLVVGTDQETALRGGEQALAIMGATGARLIGEPTIIGDPRTALEDEDAVRTSLMVLGGELAKCAALEGPR